MSLTSPRSLMLCGLLLAGVPALADRTHCGETAPHRLTAPVNGATSIAVIARAGSVRITGAPGRSVTATGTACASHRDFLGRMRLEARREGSELIIEAVIPERTVIFDWHQASLDFEVTVPGDLPIRLTDGSGRAEVTDVAALRVVDGSGELEIRRVRGSLDVEDGSGSITIIDVGGDITLSDGSGSVEIERVGGSVRIVSDGSGSLDIRDVQRDVVVERDGAGSIRVENVRGNFTVERDGSGGIDHRDVRGTVRVPRD